MNALLRSLRRDLPDAMPQAIYDAALAVYVVRLTVEVLEQQALSVFESYFLKATSLGVNTFPAIARLLGLDEADLAPAGVTLLKLNLIKQEMPTQSGDRTIVLTKAGQQALIDKYAPPSPKKKQCRLHFNTLTRGLMLCDRDVVRVEEMAKRGLPILHQEAGRPTLADLPKADVREILKEHKDFHDSSLVSVLDMKEPYLEYISGITVVFARHRETGEQLVVAYRGNRRLVFESQVLQQLATAGQLLPPDDAHFVGKNDVHLAGLVPEPVAKTAEQLLETSNVVTHLESRIELEQEAQTEAMENDERAMLAARLHELKEELRVKRADIENLLTTIRQNQVELLRAEDHRSILEKALQQASKEVIIVSPWMNRDSVNDYLCRLIGQAAARGVHVLIGYGMPYDRNAEEAERNSANVREVRTAIYNNVPPQAKHLVEIIKTSGTHEKTLVCDRAFGVSTSFNWLSYRGGGSRGEGGVLLRDPNAVGKLAAKARELFPPPVPMQPAPSVGRPVSTPVRPGQGSAGASRPIRASSRPLPTPARPAPPAHKKTGPR